VSKTALIGVLAVAGGAAVAPPATAQATFATGRAPRAGAPMLETGSQKPMPLEWIDRDTGHRMIRLSRREGSNASFYFHNNPFVPQLAGEGDTMVFYGTASNGRQLFSVNLKTLKVEQLTDHRGNISGEIVAPRRREVFYQSGDSVFSTHVDSRRTRLIYVFPKDFRGGGGGSVTTLNSDETTLAGVLAGEEKRAILEKYPKKSGYFNRIFEARIPHTLFTINVETGELNKLYEENAWLNHVQFSPSDPDLLMFCHEGPWHLVDRIWTIDTKTRDVKKIHQRTVEREIAGHEFFSRDGKIIWYDLQIPRGVTFHLAGADVKTGKATRYQMTRDEWSIHFNISADQKLIAGDGADPSQVARAPDGRWIYLFRLEGDRLKSERLVNMKHHDYRLEPNVHFSPDGKWVIFRANFEGESQVYAAEVEAQSADLIWPEATQHSKPWTRWWWMGSAVDSANLTAELETLAAAGFGGVEVTSIYGVKGYEHAFVPYLSDRWIDLLRHAAAEARRLGMGLDMPPGSGWRLGGPGVPLEDGGASLHIEAGASNGAYVAEPRPSGEQVKRAAPGGGGNALDPFSRAAVQRYLDAYGDRIKAVPTNAIRSFFHDSFEYTGNGSAELFDVFARRRGYDLKRHLPALLGRGDADVVARVKSDYRETLDEMLLEHLLGSLTAWAHARGSLSRNQAHGSPGNLLDLYAASDIPETEVFGPLGGSDNDPLISKFASSAAHVAGKQLISAETGTWLGEHFTVTLDQLKQVVDQLFVSGVNHVIYHGTAYSPREAAWPGWLFYASTQLNPRNAIWHDLPALNRYVARVQSVLQLGRPDNDVLLYWPVYDNWHDTTGLRSSFAVHRPSWFHEKPVGATARMLWQAGYGFDYVSDRLLRTHVSPDDYRVIVVPPTEHMPEETLVRLLDLARDGASVIFIERLPSDVPGFGRLEERRRRLEDVKRGVGLGEPDGNGVRRAEVGKGRVLAGDRVAHLLDAAGVRREAIVDHPGVRFIRRKHEGGRHYFISHTGSTTLEGWIPLAVSTARVAVMDPASGLSGLARLRARTDGHAEVYLRLEPGASVILRSFDRPVASAPWRYQQPLGAAMELRGPWSVSFVAGGPVLPASFSMDTLVSWTERGDEEARRFAGTARYVIHFDAPGQASSYQLDLGSVAQSARVRLNGKDLGILFARPFSVETGPLRRTGNELEIEVTNLSANRIRDLDVRGVPWKVFEDINFVGIDYKPFDASRWPLRPSGLLGPVRLRALASR
jgi:glycosyl hydrolase family 106( putative alpha-L-rhamnosidase)/oligogalacturonate lyase-like protein